MINCILSLTRKKTESKHLNLGNLSLIIHACVCVCVCTHTCVYTFLFTVKRLSTMRETRVQSLGREDPLLKEMAIHSSTTAWKIPWTVEPGRLQSMGLQKSDTAERLHFPFLFLGSSQLSFQGTSIL